MRRRSQGRRAGHPGWSVLHVVARGICLAALTACVSAPAWAQYDINWFTIDGGGATQASGGSYTLGATIGQPDAGLLTGGSYSLSGGFWVGAIAVVGVGEGEGEPGGPPLSFRLHAVAPNPLVHGTSVRFDLPEARFVRILLYDVAGRLARTLAEGPLPAGRHRRVWDGTDDGGRPVEAGIYFVRFDAETVQARQKVVVIR